MQNNKTLIRIPLVNIWYFALTLIFILLRISNIVDWSAVWLLSPLWIPWAIAGCFMCIPTILLGIIYIIELFIKLFKKLKHK